jgi:hypothetical protein
MNKVEKDIYKTNEAAYRNILYGVQKYSELY